MGPDGLSWDTIAGLIGLLTVAWVFYRIRILRIVLGISSKLVFFLGPVVVLLVFRWVVLTMSAARASM